MNIEDLKKSIEKKAKGVHVSVLSDSEIAKSGEIISTPAYDLNRILSGSLFKGIRSKVHTLFVGPEASGKSSFMCLCLAEAQKRGYTPVVIDTEGAWTDEFVKRWGIDPDKILYVYTPWIDKITVVMGQLISSEQQKLALVIDSIGGMEKLKLLEDAEKGDPKADQGSLQKEIKRMLKMIVNISKQQDSIVLSAGHYYGSPTSYGAAEDIGGGKYLRLSADVIVSLKKSKMLENGDKGKVIGNIIKAVCLKNRFYPPFQESVVEIDYRKGINSYAGILDLAIEAGLAEQGGAWYTINGQKYQGAINAQEGLRNDKTILDKLDKWLEKTGYSNINENVAKAEALMVEKEEQLKEEWQEELEEDDLKGDGRKITSKITKKGGK